MTKAGADDLTWDNNGQLQIGPAAGSFAWNWDGKLRSGSKGINSIAVKYDPMGNRIWKYSYNGTTGSTRKYIVDISSQLPVVLCEIEADPQSQDYGSLKKSYFYADAQVIAQRKHTTRQIRPFTHKAFMSMTAWEAFGW